MHTCSLAVRVAFPFSHVSPYSPMVLGLHGSWSIKK
ncbi:unnamed protein product [Acanthoscelides obtectus]|uniref:Uncharacterized protein n=1 Tax=Acanthoscelides obtectus TaxID=200917 RepID=A0A9P0JQA5_ACAOB|nr:unnamed protein product [Acanthoscelides obtectus]CAK1628987.1 hypothetical protein AOBTE_LOCUS5505 [Acanthoscelides obtectus]